MRKGIKILGKVFSAAVLLLIIVPVALSLLLDIPAVQNYAVHRAARFVSRKLETTVSIDRVDIGIFSKASMSRTTSATRCFTSGSSTPSSRVSASSAAGWS